jgi:hypothetical protein
MGAEPNAPDEVDGTLGSKKNGACNGDVPADALEKKCAKVEDACMVDRPRSLFWEVDVNVPFMS